LGGRSLATLALRVRQTIVPALESNGCRRPVSRIVGNKTADSALAMTYIIESNLAQGDAARLSNDMKLTLQKEINDVLAAHSRLGTNPSRR
jgi:hypothetical protein